MQVCFFGEDIGTVANKKRTPVPIEKALILEIVL
jgi:hypothetical protein